MSELNVMDFGAKGNGVTDDTAAIQSAIDTAAQKGKTVYFPAGVYLSSRLQLRDHVGLKGDATWSYQKDSGAIIKLNSDEVDCLLDISGAIGATIDGLVIDGGRLGSNIHGILESDKKVDWTVKKRTEDTFTIEKCKIKAFTGDGIRLDGVWLFTVRHNMICGNGKNGLWVHGWDGFVLDNWFSGNKGAGYYAGKPNASVTMTANRIEWNGGGGIVIHGGNHYNITGNYVDRSGKAAICLLNRGDECCSYITITGNVLYRNGAPNWGEPQGYENSHIYLQNVNGLVCTSNSMNVGRNDNNVGVWSPEYAIVYGQLKNGVIKDNVMHNGSLKELIVNLGNNKNVIEKDNIGNLFDESSIN